MASTAGQNRARDVDRRTSWSATAGARQGRAAARGGSLGGDHQREDRAVVVVDDERRGLPGTGDVTGPPADLREVEHALGIEHVLAGEGLELGAGQRQRAEAEMQPRQDEVG